MSPAEFRFPANVYACVLQLAYGQADFTGYGIADPSSAAIDLPAAQRAVAALIRARLPEAPATILDVGCGLGTLALELAGAGYRVHAISNDGAEIAHLQRRSPAAGQQLACSATAFEDFSTENQFDAIVLQNSAHYLNPLQLLAGAHRKLHAGGSLLIADQFIAADKRIGFSPIPVLANFLRLADRLGYRLQESQHFTVHPCIDQLLPALAEHEGTLSKMCGVPRGKLTELRAALAEDARNFASGELCYTFLHLVRLPAAEAGAAHSGEEFGDISDFQPEEIAQLFERSFNVPFDASVWQWKYGDGRGRAVCIRQQGGIVAHYGGAPRAIQYFGTPQKAIQICDVMVSPERRGFYSREGLFFRSAATFLEQQVGNTAEHLLGIGFPNIKTMHVATRLGLYEKTDDFIEVVYPALNPAELQQPARMQVQPFDPAGEDVAATLDNLWQEMAPGFQDAIIGLRDSSYLGYRFFNHPHDRYSTLQVRAAGRTRGLLVTRSHGDDTLLMDVIAPLALMQEVIAAGQRYLQAREGRDIRLRCWITRAHAGALCTPGAQLRDLEIEIPCNRWSNGPATATLTGAWWLTAGDMDFM